jgi:hypothetical protein
MADDNTAKRQLAHAQQTLLQAKIRLNSDEAGLATAKALAAVAYPDLPQGIHP